MREINYKLLCHFYRTHINLLETGERMPKYRLCFVTQNHQEILDWMVPVSWCLVRVEIRWQSEEYCALPLRTTSLHFLEQSEKNNYNSKRNRQNLAFLLPSEMDSSNEKCLKWNYLGPLQTCVSDVSKKKSPRNRFTNNIWSNPVTYKSPDDWTISFFLKSVNKKNN